MLNKIIEILGCKPKSNYGKKYFHNHNMQASIYMALVVVVLEIWMIISLTQYVMTTDKELTTSWLLSHYGPYVALVSSGLVMLVYALHYYRTGKKDNPLIGRILIAIFSFICLSFGIRVGIQSYAAGNQVFGFITMAIFVCCLYVMHPLSALVVSGGSFIIFYYLAKATEVSVNYNFFVNFLTLWITMFMFQISTYQQTRKAAEYDEELEEKNEYLERISKIDNLTGLYNNHYFTNRVSNLLLNNDGSKEYMILYINLEGFKRFNEKHGFSDGNVFLQGFASSLRKIFSNDEPVGRISADHFVVCCENKDINKYVYEMSQSVKTLSRDVRVELKVGGYIVKNNDENVLLAMDKAIYAVNELRQKSDAHYYLYDDKMADDLKMKSFVLSNIDEAVEKGYIKAYFQPIMWTKNRKICGFEALARWEDPELGVLPPYKFISTLEDFRLIDKVDKCIVEQVCQKIKIFLLIITEPLAPISVNFSRLDFELYNVEDFIKEMCDKYGVPRKYIDVEVTESAMSASGIGLYDILDRLSAEHHSLWLDDFGSGYSSLNVLKGFPF